MTTGQRGQEDHVQRLIDAGVLDGEALEQYPEARDAINRLDLHEVQTLIYVAEQVGTVAPEDIRMWLI